MGGANLEQGNKKRLPECFLVLPSYKKNTRVICTKCILKEIMRNKHNKIKTYDEKDVVVLPSSSITPIALPGLLETRRVGRTLCDEKDD